MTPTKTDFDAFYAADAECMAALDAGDMEAYRLASIRHQRALNTIMGRPNPPHSPEFEADWTDPADEYDA